MITYLLLITGAIGAFVAIFIGTMAPLNGGSGGGVEKTMPGGLLGIILS